VENVNWLDCRRVLRQLGLLFPTEAQWEYAARAGTSSVWWTGNGRQSLAGAVNIVDLHFKEYGHYPFWECEEWLDDGYTSHAPVGVFLPNHFGLHDILGNLCEWCWDSHHDDYENAPTDGSVWLDSKSPYRIIRGGGCYGTALNCRSACRYGEPIGNRNEHCGVRPVISLP
jgi:formylglycine-generating enzyme required for sulfatase activity